ncbi:MAG TPA: hypothetical protein VKX17_25420 [Planctomycetota bacterium]|nr:hypothetical protein [Planctomycetota bacterium]
MKIGSIEMSISTAVYGAILIFLALLLPIVGLSKRGAMREAWHRGTVLSGVVEGGENIDSGIEACKKLIAADSSKPAPRLFLGCLLGQNRNYKEAREAFASVEDAAKATPEDKSLALVGAGVMVCLDGVNEKTGQPANMPEAERLFQKALTYSETPDALAALALLKSWKSSPPGPDVEALVNKAFAASPAPPPKLLEQLYRLQGAILTLNHKAGEAAQAYGAVKAIDPTNTQTEDAVRNSALASLTAPGLDDAKRRATIEKVAAELEKFKGAARVDAQYAVGLAWAQLKGDPNYLAVKGPFEYARTIFRQMYETAPKDPRGCKSFVALLDERIEAISKELSVTITGFNGDVEKKGGSPWAAPEKNPGERYSKEDQDHIKALNNLLRDQDTALKKFLESGDPSKEDKLDALLRLLTCVRRQIWLLEPEQIGARDFLFKRALDTTAEMIPLDNTGRAEFSQGVLLIEKGDLAAARTALLAAAARGLKTPELTALLSQLDAKTKLADAGPDPRERRFGSAPLIRATLDTPLGPSLLKGAKITLNGNPVPATIYGSQILYVPTPEQMTNGENVVHIASDIPGAPLNFPKISFLIDKDPPTWVLDPPAPGTIKSDAVINIKLADASGVDWSTLSVGARGTSSNNQPYEVVFIRDGKYPHALPRIKVKTGEVVTRSPVAIAAGDQFPDGSMKIWIEVKDVLGNKLKDERIYQVK